MSRASAYKLHINTHTADTDAFILLADGALVGVLVELADVCHGPDQGKWSFEVLFPIEDARQPRPFPSASAGANWLSAHLACGPFDLDSELAILR